MKYIFNFSMIFLPSERSLSILNNKEVEVSLSAPATRLLLELIKYKGKTVTREALLKNVWEDYGFSGSNSNLNSYISEIRKAFIQLGYSEKIIITIPKQGIKLEANIETLVRQPTFFGVSTLSEWVPVGEANEANEANEA
ncbi:winged helix-turn-helix domain-containing protein, partial [Serratia ureilytica]|uniref:winged helix-turn-helix domain-containing protein n=1 Tax=Serratia ureilytica TaxID=300181 RepID=UPI0019D036C8